jgi:hypothetical protein
VIDPVGGVVSTPNIGVGHSSTADSAHPSLIGSYSGMHPSQRRWCDTQRMACYVKARLVHGIHWQRTHDEWRAKAGTGEASMDRFEQPYSGQRCPQPGCDGVLRVESTKVRGENRRRYFKCNKCGKSPENNVQSVPLRYAPGRSRRMNSK